MKISVIIITHNQASYLEKVLAGYARQVQNPYEVIVAEDGTDSETGRVVNEFRRNVDFPVHHVSQEHIGTPRLSHARNMGTRSASGEYIIYTDGDCIPRPQFIRDHEKLAQPGWYVQGKRIFVKDRAFDLIQGDESRWRLFLHWMTGNITKPHLIFRVPGYWTEQKGIEGTRGCNMAAFLEDIVDVNGHNEEFVGFWRQDSEFVLRLQQAGIRRKNARYSAVLFHLPHEKVLVETDLIRNNDLLEQTQRGPVSTRHGLTMRDPVDKNTA